MKTEFLKSLGITDEQIRDILADNGRDIEREKSRLATNEAKISELQKEIEEYKSTITSLEKNKAGTEALQKEIDSYKQAEADRAVAEAKAKLSSRFDKIAGDKKFIHDYVRSGVISDFEKALSDESNKGKGDSEIFETLTKDKDYFAPQNQTPPNMGSMNNSNFLSANPEIDNMTFEQYKTWRKENP